ncbi:transcriptional regulator [Sphingomonas silueang]|uniref:transcriptional regulator n=1 Tax=Sphingomonas silueang TaxID=3156617 RepID=UPI0032B4B7B5
MSMGRRRYESGAAAFAAAVDMVGSQAAMARLLGVSQPTIHRWVKGKLAAPADYVPTLCEATDISKYEFRPDLFDDLAKQGVDPATGGRA